jgi:hypothetical protein
VIGLVLGMTVAKTRRLSGRLSRMLKRGLLAVACLSIVVIAWLVLRRDEHPPSSPSSNDLGREATAGTTVSSARPTEPEPFPRIDSGSIGEHDPVRREQIRRRILEAWSRGEGETARAAKQERFVGAPGVSDGIEREYVQAVITEQYRPLVRSCYSELLSRRADAAGQLFAQFTIVGDEQVGGIVDSVQIELEGGLVDAKLEECLRESLTTLAFRPPKSSGSSTLRVPITLVATTQDAEARAP